MRASDLPRFCRENFLAQLSLLTVKVSQYKGFNPIALRKAKIVYNFGLSECNRVNYGMQSTDFIDFFTL